MNKDENGLKIMENLAEHPKYQKYLKKREAYFIDENKFGKAKSVPSPSGNFVLTVQRYKTKEGCWNYSRGIIEDKRSSHSYLIADIKRNYCSFPYLWIQHPNGKEYLICGEDYQG